MEIMKDTGYMRFGHLDYESQALAGSRSVMPQKNVWVTQDRKSSGRVLGTWRRMPKVGGLARFHNF